MENVKLQVDFILSSQVVTPVDQERAKDKYKLFEIAQILTEIGRLFFSYSRTHGCSEQSMNTARVLLSAWRVKWKEYKGPSAPILKHVVG